MRPVNRVAPHVVRGRVDGQARADGVGVAENLAFVDMPTDGLAPGNLLGDDVAIASPERSAGIRLVAVRSELEAQHLEVRVVLEELHVPWEFGELLDAVLHRVVVVLGRHPVEKLHGQPVVVRVLRPPPLLEVAMEKPMVVGHDHDDFRCQG